MRKSFGLSNYAQLQRKQSYAGLGRLNGDQCTCCDLRLTVQRALPGAAQEFEFFFTADKTHGALTLAENRGGIEAVPDPVTAAATP